jgi:hypothetical protein
MQRADIDGKFWANIYYKKKELHFAEKWYIMKQIPMNFFGGEHMDAGSTGGIVPRGRQRVQARLCNSPAAANP